MAEKKKIKCYGNAEPCKCESCLAEELHSKSLKILEDTKRSIHEVKKAMINLVRAENLLKSGEFVLNTKKTG